MEEKVYLNNDEMLNAFRNQKVYVYGTGVDAETLTNDVKDRIEIVSYIDEKRFGKNVFFREKRVISIYEYLQSRKNNEPIIVAASRFAMDISENLTKNGLVEGCDFFIWDNLGYYRFSEVAESYCKLLKKMWGDYKHEDKSKQILIPFDNRAELEPVVVCAYFANYFAQKEKATIKGYFRFGSDKKNASDTILKYFTSINMDELVDTSLTDEYKKEASSILEETWEQIITWKEWNEITIYGIHFGTTIVRDLLRTEVPTFDCKSPKMYKFLSKSIQTIVFWYHYFQENDIKVTLMADGVSWDGYIREISLAKGIPTYSVHDKLRRLDSNYHTERNFMAFKKMWGELSDKEQRIGLNWAKEQIEKRNSGIMVDEIGEFEKKCHPFAQKKKDNRVLVNSDKIKLIIFPHIFEEDCYSCGENLFYNNYFAWLSHLGELSEKYTEYEWYMKIHPNSSKRDIMIYNMIIEKYPNITLLPKDVSPIQLKEEGAAFALTVHGTIGFEYPELGIQVINAGRNRTDDYSFTWNPQTIQEYDNLIDNLENVHLSFDINELYECYSMCFLICEQERFPIGKVFFQEEYMGFTRGKLENRGLPVGDELYKKFLESFSWDFHYHVLEVVPNIIKYMDEWEEGILYKSHKFMDLVNSIIEKD